MTLTQGYIDRINGHGVSDSLDRLPSMTTDATAAIFGDNPASETVLQKIFDNTLDYVVDGSSVEDEILRLDPGFSAVENLTGFAPTTMDGYQVGYTAEYTLSVIAKSPKRIKEAAKFLLGASLDQAWQPDTTVADISTRLQLPETQAQQPTFVVDVQYHSTMVGVDFSSDEAIQAGPKVIVYDNGLNGGPPRYENHRGSRSDFQTVVLVIWVGSDIGTKRAQLGRDVRDEVIARLIGYQPSQYHGMTEFLSARPLTLQSAAGLTVWRIEFSTWRVNLGD